MTELEQTLLAENRQLRLELEATRNRRVVLPIREDVRLVKESELPLYAPWSINKIKEARRRGKLRGYPDPLNTNLFLYNLDEVLATILAGRPTKASVARFIPDDLKVAV